MTGTMEFTIKEEVPSVEDYIKIRIAAGLSRKSIEAASVGLRNSIYAITVIHSGKPIGLGRIIGDGGCFFQIVDIAVVPEHQKKGVGNKIMTTLMNYIKQQAPSTAYVSLMADHDTPSFYAKYGFEMSVPPTRAGMFLRIS